MHLSQEPGHHICMAGAGPDLKSCVVSLLLLLLQALLQVVQVVWGLLADRSCGAGSTHHSMTIPTLCCYIC